MREWSYQCIASSRSCNCTLNEEYRMGTSSKSWLQKVQTSKTNYVGYDKELQGQRNPLRSCPCAALRLLPCTPCRLSSGTIVCVTRLQVEASVFNPWITTIGCIGLPCVLPSSASFAVGSSQYRRVRSVMPLSI